MMNVEITHTGLKHAKNAGKRPYGYLHLTDFMDVWLPNDTVGIDHLVSATGDVELRIKGKTPGQLPRSCPDCGETQTRIDEPMISGFRGFLCTDEDCPRDS